MLKRVQINSGQLLLMRVQAYDQLLADIAGI